MGNFLTYVLLSWAIFIAVNCAKKTRPSQMQNSTESPCFVVIKAESELKGGGIPQAGSNLEFYIHAVVQSNELLRFDTLQYGQLQIPLYVARNQEEISTKPVTWSVGDTLLLRASHRLGKKKIPEMQEQPLESAVISSICRNKKILTELKIIYRLNPPNRN